ncbi:MAG TPA: TIGR03364 family FAD-dependent oxidoreductase [Marmoricola sp.]|nr:TIGR03364 family FAD-dependent oxidoreductase [Marmoricola sp.]
MTSPDLIVVGGGIVGLAHAVDAHLRGLAVTMLERDERAVGASVRNFGHVCTTPQAGEARPYALEANERWRKLAALADFEIETHGTVAVARTEAELAVLEEFATTRAADEVQLLTPAGVEDRIGWLPADTVGGAWLTRDLRVDPRAAIPALAHWLVDRGVDVRFGVNVASIADGVVATNQGEFVGDRVVHAAGHDVDRLFPTIAEEYGIRRCRLQMFEVAPPQDLRIGPAVLTGTSLLRYGGFEEQPSAARVRAAFEANQPDLLEAGVNLMLTQRPDGSIVLGDTHHYGKTLTPFEDEDVANIILREGARLFGTDLTVRRRWRGVYAHSTQTDFLIGSPDPRTRVVSVTSGVGMTTGLGLAPAVLDEFLA